MPRNADPGPGRGVGKPLPLLRSTRRPQRTATDLTVLQVHGNGSEKLVFIMGFGLLALNCEPATSNARAE